MLSLNRPAAALLIIAASLRGQVPPALPDIGSRIPPFEVQDQEGNLRSFDSIRGPHGAILLFHRSADW